MYTHIIYNSNKRTNWTLQQCRPDMTFAVDWALSNNYLSISSAINGPTERNTVDYIGDTSVFSYCSEKTGCARDEHLAAKPRQPIKINLISYSHPLR